MEEVPLTGGNVGTVVRVGNTVRRPGGFWSPSVHALLTHLRDVGFPAAPRSLGFDERGRHVVEYVEGDVPMPFAPRDHLGAVRTIGALIRDFHDASAEFVPPPDARWSVTIPPDAADLIIHHDLAPWNIIDGGDRWTLIDWDNAGPGSRLWDLAYAVHGFVPLDPAVPPGVAAERLAALIDAYGLDDEDRARLVAMLVPRILSMVDLLDDGHRTGTQPWARLWSEGHADVWRADADYTRRHLDVLSGGRAPRPRR